MSTTRSGAPGARTIPVASLMLLCGLSQAAAIVHLPAAGEIQIAFNVGERSVQWLLNAFIIPFALALIFIGPLSDRIGRRVIMIWATLLFFVGSLLAALAPTFEVLLVARVIQGVASCAVMILPRAMIRDIDTGPAAARALTYTAMALSLSQIIAPVVSGLLIPLLGWAGGFYVLAAMSLPGLVLAVRLPETARGGGAAGNMLRSFGLLLSHRRFMAIVFSIGLLNGGYYAFFTAAPLVYMNALGYTASEFSFIVMLWGVGFFITGFVVTRMVGSVSAHATILSGSVLNITTSLYWIAVAYLSGNPLLLVLPVLTFAASNALFVPRAMNVALTAAPVEIAGAASAMIAFSQWGFSAVGSAASTVVSHESPATMGFLMLGFVTASLLIYLAGGGPAASAKGA